MRRAIDVGRKGWNEKEWVKEAAYYRHRQVHRELDFYGNSLLHCASAAVGRHWHTSRDDSDLWVIKHLMGLSPDLEQTNTSGETFLHILCRRASENTHCLEPYVSILRDLAAKNFDFSKRDYQGRTILHCLLECDDVANYSININILEEILAIMKSQVAARDTSGLVFSDYLLQRAKTASNMKYLMELENILAPSTYWVIDSDWESLLRGMSDGAKVYEWLSDIQISGKLAWTDNAGNTPLTALLKSWQDKYGGPFLQRTVKQMVSGGAEIHVRDREGHSPLALAALRGFRSAVVGLLEMGASVHARNNNGQGILQQVGARMDKAKTSKDDGLYASLLTCYNALVDAGAVNKPTEKDEWMLPSARSNF
jgi:ankyrin repeat protein